MEVNSSTRNPTSRRKPSTTIHVYIEALKVSPPSILMCLKTNIESTQEIATPIMVTQCAPLRPTFEPNKPAMIDPISGDNTIQR